MSPVSPVFDNEATVSIGLKNVLEYWTHKRTRSGNIHSKILDIHAVKQSEPMIPSRTLIHRFRYINVMESWGMRSKASSKVYSLAGPVHS